MIWRLTYCNKDGVEARLDIIRGASTPIEVIEGTANPFILNYKLDKTDKSGFFMTSSADISIFETPTFNIDNLKTSSETEIKVEHYINGVLDWSGFVIPDFFSKTIGSPATVEMVASDRLGTLKSITLDDLNQYVSMRDLAVACLAKTGLSLPLYTMADFVNNSQTNAFFKALGLAGRLSDTKGRNISCYDILKSILVASNSKLVQQSGAWYIVNKFQHEQGSGSLFSTLTASTSYSEQTVSFSDVQIGARRTIIPVGATTGVFQEFGGGRSYPDNFDFREYGLIPEFNFPDWTKMGAFNVALGNKSISGYNFDGQIQFGTETVDNYFFNSNTFNLSNYLQMNAIAIPYTSGQIEVVIDLNATAQTVSAFMTNVTAVKIAVGAAKSDSPTLWLNKSGVFADANEAIHNLDFGRGSPYDAQTQTFNVKGVINNPEGYSIVVRIYGSRDGAETNRREIAVHFAKVSFKNVQESPKGNIFKRNQGTGFTKEHDIDTTIFGDYMRKGLDGYFYEYPIDDTSSLHSTSGTLTEPLWTAHGDTEQLPLLRHVTRQKSRMFSLAHNMVSARIDVSTFKPLNIFVDCNSARHVVVSASYDFLRSEVEVELEQIAYTTLDVREYIYSYFGDGEGGISSVGGISGGGGGGGSTAPSYWQLDENGNLYTIYNAYSLQELSAYGFGGSGGGGGGDGLIETVYSYSNLGGTFSNSDLNNTFNAYTINQLHLRITTLENGGGGGGSAEWDNILNKPAWIGATKPSYSWSEITDKPSTFAPSAHTHTKSQITDFAHTHPFTQITGTATTTQIPNLAISKITGLQAALDLKLNKSIFDDFFEWDSVNNAIKAKYTFYSIGEVSAYGYGGSGGGGGEGGLIETVYGYSNLGGTFSNTDLNNTFNAYTINQLHVRLTTIENGGGSGSVSSVGLSAPTGFTVSGSPVTSSGTLALTFTAGYSLPTTAKQTAWDNHLSATNNPHSVTAGQVGALALTGGAMSNTNLVPNLNADLLDGYNSSLTASVNTVAVRDANRMLHSNIRLDRMSATLSSFGWYRVYTSNIDNAVGTGVLLFINRSYLITNNESYTFSINISYGGGISISQISGRANTRRITNIRVAYVNSGELGVDIYYNSTAANAVYVSGIGDGVFQSPASTPSTGLSYVEYNTVDGLGSNLALTGVTNITASGTVKLTATAANSPLITRGIDGYAPSTDTLDNLYLNYNSTKDVLLVYGGGNVGIGNVAPSYKLDVSGTGRFTGDLTVPKVIFSAAGWAMVQAGTELQMQYNGVAKLRFLSGGSIVAVQEITAYS